MANPKFKKDLASCLNINGIDNELNISDINLAEYLLRSLGDLSSAISDVWVPADNFYAIKGDGGKKG